MTIAQLNKLCKLWQKRLRLQDWVIIVEEMTDGDEFDHGSCDAKEGTGTGIIRVKFDGGEELTLVHELLHIQFGNMHFDRAYEHHRHQIFETALDRIAGALIRAYNR